MRPEEKLELLNSLRNKALEEQQKARGSEQNGTNTLMMFEKELQNKKSAKTCLQWCIKNFNTRPATIAYFKAYYNHLHATKPNKSEDAQKHLLASHREPAQVETQKRQVESLVRSLPDARKANNAARINYITGELDKLCSNQELKAHRTRCEMDLIKNDVAATSHTDSMKIKMQK